MTTSTEHRYIANDDQILGGEPIILGVKKLAKEGENAVDKGAKVVGKGINKGLDQAGSFFHKLIHHNDKDQNQSQTQPSSEPDQN